MASHTATCRSLYIKVGFAGLDWASQADAACVSDVRGAVALQLEVKHDAAGLAELCRLLREAGVAPMTSASGKSKALVFRWACNHHLRAALTCPADKSRHASAWAAHVYAKARARSCDHPHAMRILARAWLRVIGRAWQDR
jgi:hypothetical protein